jgi:hypothetical protein
MTARRLAAAALCAMLLGAGGAPALAQTATPIAPEELKRDLYQDALQSIAEGRRSDASHELMLLLDKEPKHAGAWLELALTQCALGHADEAERMFATIETRFDPPPAFIRLIAEVREQGCNRWQAFSSSTLALGRGIDQNVNQGARTANYVIDAPGGQIEYVLSDDFRPKHDQYTLLSVEYTREVTPNGSLGFVQFQGRRNDHLHAYDTGSLFTGIETPWRFDRWTLRTTGTLGLVTLGGKLYQRQAQLQARVGPPLRLPAGTGINLIAGITYADFQTLSNFNSTTFELRGLVTHRSGATFASASLGYLQDRALAQRPGGDRDGWFGSVLLRRRLAAGLSGELTYTRQDWNSRLPYSPGLIDQVRAQQTQVLRANLVYALSKNQSLQLEARAVRNHENISIFQYNNRQLQFSWQWQGP